MPLRKDPMTYTATLQNLKLKAFGFDQVIRESFSITVYQVTCRPQRWAARPQLSRGDHKWIGPDAEHVMKLVQADFEELVTPWAAAPAPAIVTPTLKSATDIPPRRQVLNPAAEAMARRRARAENHG